MKPRSAWVAVRIVMVLVCAGAAQAAAPSGADAIGELNYLDCFSDSGAHGCATPAHNSLAEPIGIAVSPDSRNVYVTSRLSNSVTIFARNPFSGRLTYQGCIANAGANGCTAPGDDSLADPRDIVVTPDGKSVYATAFGADSVTRFNRTANGALTLVQCFAQGGNAGCENPTNQALLGPEDLAATNTEVYVAAIDSNAVNHFDRNVQNGGELSFQYCIADNGANGCDNPPQDPLGGANGIALSSQGTSVYVASRTDSSVTHLTADPIFGALSYQGCIANTSAAGCIDAPHDSLDLADSVAVSPDDKTVYATSVDALTVLPRNSSNGFIGYGGCIADLGAHGCVDPPNDTLDFATSVVVSPDSRNLYVAGYNSASVTAFNRTSPTSVPSFLQCIADAGGLGCEAPPHPSFMQANDVAVSPDGKSVYVAATNGVTALRRHVADCAGKPATLVGTKGADRIKGTQKADVIAGLGGKDRISGLGGRDRICGGAGKDRLRGGKGRDRLLGQGGADLLVGGPGKDKLIGGPGKDRVRR